MVKSRKVKNIFQSTPSVGRATTIYNADIHLICISIHALRGEGDANIIKAGIMQSVFQSTPSVGRATSRTACFIVDRGISIHTLRGEGDVCKVLFVGVMLTYFNPRPPWGGRRQGISRRLRRAYFNPRPPWGGRLFRYQENRKPLEISIHALRGEGDAVGVHRV